MSDLVEQIDNILPQTQCGLCGYNGCRPYAEAIAIHGETINRCPPGGLNTLTALSKLLHVDPTPLLNNFREKPALQAVIREDECIGCTKCIQACPIDAIIGSAKLMHTVLTAECTGCELCVAPCPVDCIDMVEIAKPMYQPMKAKQRYTAKQQRLTQSPIAKTPVGSQTDQFSNNLNNTVDARQAAIQAALARMKAKNANKESI